MTTHLVSKTATNINITVFHSNRAVTSQDSVTRVMAATIKSRIAIIFSSISFLFRYEKPVPPFIMICYILRNKLRPAHFEKAIVVKDQKQLPKIHTNQKNRHRDIALMLTRAVKHWGVLHVSAFK